MVIICLTLASTRVVKNNWKCHCYEHVGLGYSSVVERLASMCETLVWVQSPAPQKNENCN